MCCPAMSAEIERIAALKDSEIARATPYPHAYPAIYSCVAWPYWFGYHAQKPWAVQLERLRNKCPQLRSGRAICAAMASTPALPSEVWRHIYAYAGDDFLTTVRIAIAVARQRHAGSNH